MTTTKGQSLVAVGTAMTTRIAVSAVIAGAAVLGTGAGAASAAPCATCAAITGSTSQTTVAKTSSVGSQWAVARQTTARASRGAAGRT